MLKLEWNDDQQQELAEKKVEKKVETEVEEVAEAEQDLEGG